MDPHSRAPKENTSHGNEVLPQVTTPLIQRPHLQQTSALGCKPDDPVKKTNKQTNKQTNKNEHNTANLTDVKMNKDDPNIIIVIIITYVHNALNDALSASRIHNKLKTQSPSHLEADLNAVPEFLFRFFSTPVRYARWMSSLQCTESMCICCTT